MYPYNMPSQVTCRNLKTKQMAIHNLVIIIIRMTIECRMYAAQYLVCCIVEDGSDTFAVTLPAFQVKHYPFCWWEGVGCWEQRAQPALPPQPPAMSTARRSVAKYNQLESGKKYSKQQQSVATAIVHWEQSVPTSFSAFNTFFGQQEGRCSP